MGNTASANARLAGFSNLVEELGQDVQYERSVGDTRFLKTIKARHSLGSLVVKIFYKPADAGISLESLVQRLKRERIALADAPNLLAYQTVVETERAGYLVRQWLASSLYDRISTRPFLAPIEKKWVSYQFLEGMRIASARGVPHGDLKCENLLVTSSLVLYITDFSASIKPTYLPLDDPDDFTVFFDTSGRRACYLAPERFFDSASSIARKRSAQRATRAPRDNANHETGGQSSTPVNRVSTLSDPLNLIIGSSGQAKVDEQVTEQMDVFAAACAIAELWRDGSPTFTLSQLFQYRNGKFDVDTVLTQIPDEAIRNMLRSMLALEPSERGSFSEILRAQHDEAFPSAFYDFFHTYMIALQRSTPNETTRRSEAAPVKVTTQLRRADALSSDLDSELSRITAASPTAALRSDADRRIERLYQDWSLLFEKLPSPASVRTSGEESDVPDFAESAFPVALSIPGVAPQILSSRCPAPEQDGPALILLSVIISNLRNACRPSVRMQALELALYLANGYLTNTSILDRLLPYTMALFDDPVPPVRAAACRISTQIFMLVDTLNPANATLFSEYVIPNFRPLASDPSVLVRAAYAASLAHLCEAAQRHVAMLQSTTRNSTAAIQEAQADSDLHDSQQEILHNLFQVEVVSLLTDPSTTVKRSLLQDIDKLCAYFGAAVTNDILLSHMITYLNDKDWRLREGFFRAIFHVGVVAGPESLENYILPLMLQALNDEEENVVLRVLIGLRMLVVKSSLPTSRIFEALEAVSGFLCHPNRQLRYQCVSFIVACGTRMGATQNWAFIYPHVRPLLVADVPQAEDIAILDVLKPPLSRNVIRIAMAWAAKSGNSKFWRVADKPKGAWPLNDQISSLGLSLMAGADIAHLPRIQLPRSEEDDGYIDRLRAVGMTDDDELKLMALKSTIRKVARLGGGMKGIPEPEGGALISQRGAITQLGGVNSQNIFFHNPATKTAPSRSDAASVISKSARSDVESPLAKHLTHYRVSNISRVASEASQVGSEGERKQRLEAFLNAEAARQMASPIEDADKDTAAESRTRHRPDKSKASAAVLALRTSAKGENSDIRSPADPANLTELLPETESGMAPEGRATEATVDDEPAFSTYDGGDPFLKAHLQLVYQHRARSRVIPTSSRKSHLTKANQRLLSQAARAGSASAPRPEGKLVAYFNEHEGPITAIAVSADHVFFVTGSEDTTLRVWDSARLEKNVTARSRAVYTGHNSGITGCLCLSSPRCFASTAKDGSVHVWRVDLSANSSLPRYSRPKIISNFQFSKLTEHATSMVEIELDGDACLVLGTSLGRITILDLRTMQVLQTLQNGPQKGAITCLCEDPKGQWLLAGTESGRMCVWDLRFTLMIREWQLSDRSTGLPLSPVSCVNSAQADQRNHAVIGVSQMAGRKSSGINTVAEVWNVQTGQQVTSFGVKEAGHDFQLDDPRTKSDVRSLSSKPCEAIEQLLLQPSLLGEDLQPPCTNDLNMANGLALATSTSGYRSSVTTVRDLGKDWVDAGAVAASGKDHSNQGNLGGWLITSGSDRVIRFWDLGKIERSKVVTPASARGAFSRDSATDGVAQFTHTRTLSATSQQGKVARMPILGPAASKDAPEGKNVHRDAVTALAVLQSPFRCIVTGDRSGKINVWE